MLMRLNPDCDVSFAEASAAAQCAAAFRPTALDGATACRLPERSEAELIARAIAGEVHAFYELIHPYERAVFLSALSLLRNEADAEDVAQETFLKSFQKLSSFRQEAKFSTWLIQIAINEAKCRLRKSRRHLHDSLDEPQQIGEGEYVRKDLADWREIPSEALERRELRDALRKGVDSLADKYRTVLILRDVMRLSVNETAGSLGVSEGVVKTRLFRARLQMRDALASQNYRYPVFS